MPFLIEKTFEELNQSAMIEINRILLTLAVIASAGWVYLLTFRGRFWQCDQRLSSSDEALNEATFAEWPSICAIVPARNEASVIPQSLQSLLSQTYSGRFQVMLVDDQSTDGTANIARHTAQACQAEEFLQIMTTEPLPTGWSGKLWAVHQGIKRVIQDSQKPLPDYFLLTDADILHDVNNLKQLVTKAEQEHLDLVSLMVLLRCKSFWEKLLIPAFIFFFQKLYPFPWVNQPRHPMAAAAGGCILVRRDTLMAVGGIEVIRKALIDDCALGAAIKGNRKPDGQTGRIWLGLTTTTISLRAYPSLQSIWEMVARTAFTQLSYSFALLFLSLVGMTLIYVLPPAGLLLGWATGDWAIALSSGLAWALMTIAYWPTIRLYKLSPLWALTLPLVGVLYTLMTLDSAVQHVQGRGSAWKGRVYSTAAVK
jgi:hopene-associated glycosyltransferase HpnB